MYLDFLSIVADKPSLAILVLNKLFFAKLRYTSLIESCISSYPLIFKRGPTISYNPVVGNLSNL